MTKYGLPLRYIKILNDTFKKFPKIKKVVIYGSRATGSYTRQSDIDLAIDIPKMGIDELITLKSELNELPIPYDFDLVNLPSINNINLKKEIIKYGKLKYTSTISPL